MIAHMYAPTALSNTGQSKILASFVNTNTYQLSNPHDGLCCRQRLMIGAINEPSNAT